jgi:excisionase family DNA binding protein
MYKNISESNNTLTSSGLLTTRELASLLRFSERHIANLVKSRRIPRIKVGHAVRFDGDAVLRALKAYEEEEILIK